MRFFALILLACALVCAVPARAQDRRGFTTLLTMGYGLQWYNGDGPKESALAGPNLGIGAFVSEDVAIMARTSGTYRSYTWDTSLGEYDNAIIAGTVAVDVQWWVMNRLNVEFGAGLGVLSTSYGSARGYGLLAGAAYSLWTRPGYGVQLGIEFAPFFKNSTTIRNLGFNLGFQFF